MTNMHDVWKSEIAKAVRTGIKIQIYSENKIDKSKIIRESLKKSSVTYVNFSGLKTSTDAYINICENLLLTPTIKKHFSLKQRNEAKKRFGLLKKEKVNFQEQFEYQILSVFEELTNHIEKQSQKKPHCIVFENLHEILSWKHPERFLALMRSVIQFHSHIAYIFSFNSSDKMHLLMSGYKAAFYKQTLNIPLETKEERRIGQAEDFAFFAFMSHKRAQAWLKKPNAEFGDRPPLEYAKTEEGLLKIKNLLKLKDPLQRRTMQVFGPLDKRYTKALRELVKS